MADMINILVKHPGEDWHKETVENDLYVFQRIVGGYIEEATLTNGEVIICNEEGWLMDLPYNCDIECYSFCGTLIKCKADGEEFASIW